MGQHLGVASHGFVEQRFLLRRKLAGTVGHLKSLRFFQRQLHVAGDATRKICMIHSYDKP